MTFSGQQCFCFIKRRQLHFRLIDFPFGRSKINLNNLLARNFADVFYCRLKLYYIVFNSEISTCYFKIRIRQAKTKRILYLLLCKGFKISVSNINILSIHIFFLAAKIIRQRIISIIIRYCVSQSAAGALITAEYVGNGFSALLTSLPNI